MADKHNVTGPRLRLELIAVATALVVFACGETRPATEIPSPATQTRGLEATAGREDGTRKSRIVFQRKSFEVGKFPAAVLSDGERIWVANMLGDSVTALTPQGEKLGTYPVGKGPVGLAFDGRNVWVANSGVDESGAEPLEPGTITKLAPDGSVLGTFAVGVVPFDLAYDGNAVWVATAGDDTVTRLSLDGSLLAQARLSSRPRAIGVVEERLWVLSADADTATVLSPEGEVVAVYPTGRAPQALVYDGADVWIANAGDSTLMKMDPDGEVIATFPIAPRPVGLAFDGSSVWVGRAFQDAGITRLGLNGEQLRSFPVEGDPRTLAWDGNALWVSRPRTDEVLRLELQGVPFSALDSPSPPGPLTPRDADLSRYMLSQEQLTPLPGGVSWTDAAADAMEGLQRLSDLMPDPEDIAGSYFVSDYRRFAEGALIIVTYQAVVQFETQDGAAELMRRLRRPPYPALREALPHFDYDFEISLHELEPPLYEPDSFAVQTASSFSPGFRRQTTFSGRTDTLFQGWLRHGNLVSLLEFATVLDLNVGEAYVREFLAERSGMSYSLEQFEAVLANAYRNLKEGANRKPVSIATPMPGR